MASVAPVAKAPKARSRARPCGRASAAALRPGASPPSGLTSTRSSPSGSSPAGIRTSNLHELLDPGGPRQIRSPSVRMWLSPDLLAVDVTSRWRRGRPRAAAPPRPPSDLGVHGLDVAQQESGSGSRWLEPRSMLPGRAASTIEGGAVEVAPGHDQGRDGFGSGPNRSPGVARQRRLERLGLPGDSNHRPSRCCQSCGPPKAASLTRSFTPLLRSFGASVPREGAKMTRPAAELRETGSPEESPSSRLRIPFVRKATLVREGRSRRRRSCSTWACAGVFIERTEADHGGGGGRYYRLPWPDSEVPLKARCRVAWWHAPGAQRWPRKSLPPGAGLAVRGDGRGRPGPPPRDYLEAVLPPAPARPPLPPALARGRTCGRRSMKPDRSARSRAARCTTFAVEHERAGGRPLHDRDRRVGAVCGARGRPPRRGPLRARHHGPGGGARASTPIGRTVRDVMTRELVVGRWRPTPTRTACAR